MRILIVVLAFQIGNLPLLRGQSPTSSSETSPKSTATLAGLREQRDVVIGKKRRTLALLQQVTTWYEVDPHHPDAVAKSKELRQFYRSYLTESIKLSKIYQELDAKSPWGKLSPEDREVWGKIDKDIADARNGEEIYSKLRQLEAMGFDHTLEGWK